MVQAVISKTEQFMNDSIQMRSAWAVLRTRYGGLARNRPQRSIGRSAVALVLLAAICAGSTGCPNDQKIVDKHERVLEQEDE